jgi:hypothetical protein
MEKIVSDTLHHATLSMFVTSLTTSAALYSNGASSITAIKCFSIYAGTTVLCNFIIMIIAITREDPITTKVIMVTNIEDVYIHTVVNITQIAPMIHIVS